MREQQPLAPKWAYTSRSRRRGAPTRIRMGYVCVFGYSSSLQVTYENYKQDCSWVSIGLQLVCDRNNERASLLAKKGPLLLHLADAHAHLLSLLQQPAKQRPYVLVSRVHC